MFGISGTELFMIVVFALLIFGPDKLPEFGRTVGKIMNEFKRAQESMESMIRAEMYASDKDKRPGAAKASIASDIDDDDDEDDEEDEEE